MSGLIISLLTLVLILISLFTILLVLMQRTSQSGGMGAALGGGAAESAFGSDTSNVLTKGTIYSTIAFFVVALGLFLVYQSKIGERSKILDPIELISDEQKDPLAEANSAFEDLTTVSVESEGEGEAIPNVNVDIVNPIDETVEGSETANPVQVEIPVEDAEKANAELPPAKPN